MTKTFHLKILDINTTLYDGQIKQAVIPTSSGNICLMSDHAHFVANTTSGTITITAENNEVHTIELTKNGAVTMKENEGKVLLI